MKRRPATDTRVFSALCAALLVLSGCSGHPKNEPSSASHVSSARSAIFALEDIPQTGISTPRAGALLGIYVAEFLSRGITSAVHSALEGIAAQVALAQDDDGIDDEDFALLQAFADALSVDIPELLNRSPDRGESLARYLEALQNVGSQATARFTELEAAITTIREREREQRKEISALEREQRDAMREKDFATAGELQKQLSEKEAAFAEVGLKLDQTRSIHGTFEDLIEIYSERVLALEANRQALIVGITVIDVPGAEDFDIIKSPSRRDQRESLESIIDGEGIGEILNLDEVR